LKVCLACEERFEAPDWRCPACGETPRTNGYTRFAPELASGVEGFDPAWVEPLASLEAASFWFRARNRLVVWAIRRYFPAARSLLEIGCGTGFVLAAVRGALPGVRLAGGDALPQALDHARRRVPRANLVQLDARRIPFDREFDVVGAFDVLEHIEDDELVLAQMFRAARPGGGAVLLVPQHRWLWGAQDEGHQRRYSRAELIGKARTAGFEILRETSFVSLLLPAMAASRLIQRNARLKDSTRELRAAQVLGPLFERVLDLERAAIERGLSFPAGGSLLVVARRPG